MPKFDPFLQAQNRRAVRLYTYYRQHLPMPVFESNEPGNAGLVKIWGRDAGGCVVSKRTRFRRRWVPTQIVINHRMPLPGKLFVLMHELGHWYCHYHPHGRWHERERQREIEAEVFAYMALDSFKVAKVKGVRLARQQWEDTAVRCPDTIEVVTRCFDIFWREHGQAAKDAV